MTSELDGIVRAMKVLEGAYEAVFKVAREGMTADEIDLILGQHLRAAGGEFGSVRSTPYVVDPTGAPPKLRLNRQPLVRGKLFGMDNSIRVGDWWADLGRYGYFEPVPASLSAAHCKVLDRQSEIAAIVRPNMPMRAIWDQVQHDIPFEVHRVGPEASMVPFCGNATKKVSEQMDQNTRDNLCFQVGQVICIELWAGLSGGIEDMYLVEESGVRRLSTLPQEIRSV